MLTGQVVVDDMATTRTGSVFGSHHCDVSFLLSIVDLELSGQLSISDQISLEVANIITTLFIVAALPTLKAVEAEIVPLAFGTTNPTSFQSNNRNGLIAIGAKFGVLLDPILVQF